MEARVVCVLFVLISCKFNMLCFLAIVATLKLSAMGADFYWLKSTLFFFPLWHEYRKIVENRICWSVVTFGGDVMLYIISW
jgi:hypothetical protein